MLPREAVDNNRGRSLERRFAAQQRGSAACNCALRGLALSEEALEIRNRYLLQSRFGSQSIEPIDGFRIVDRL
jgi:hypothetical protein